MSKSVTYFVVAILSTAITTTAIAKPKHKTHHGHLGSRAIITCDTSGCSDWARSGHAKQVIASSRRAASAGVITCDDSGCSDVRRSTRARQGRAAYARSESTVVGRRPAGCPHLFCGCEASLYLFGKIRPELNLAANWIRKFPRTVPAPGMAAARNHHVMVLMSHVEGSRWLVHDGNSGGGLTREHVISIRGYVVVDPHAVRTASNARSNRGQE